MNYLKKKSGASERRFYQKITDIYAECSADYDPHSDITRQFYAKVQNLGNLWFNCSRVLGLIIESRIWTWKDGLGNKIHKSDLRKTT